MQLAGATSTFFLGLNHVKHMIEGFFAKWEKIAFSPNCQKKGSNMSSPSIHCGFCVLNVDPYLLFA